MKPKRRIVSKNRDTHSICFLRLPITSAIVCSPANLQARDRIRFSAFLQDLFILVSVILTWIVKIPSGFVYFGFSYFDLDRKNSFGFFDRVLQVANLQITGF
ncbi:hypothetical protein [Leptospira mayottensis]|uniref:Uncharacterized protein n=1 Tax=Leptospira mayottensis 200901122 TaxID=1193010 RepID=A0AA87MRP0_9LEPT|nr:hypothetical protein [Leptospira mayottensis]EKS01151.1 hypothetical protein LEP1GSC125_1194 [Leptospira mayottensis 200901122]